jgi:hypothetical protein
MTKSKTKKTIAQPKASKSLKTKSKSSLAEHTKEASRNTDEATTTSPSQITKQIKPLPDKSMPYSTEEIPRRRNKHTKS